MHACVCVYVYERLNNTAHYNIMPLQCCANIKSNNNYNNNNNSVMKTKNKIKERKRAREKERNYKTTNS